MHMTTKPRYVILLEVVGKGWKLHKECSLESLGGNFFVPLLRFQRTTKLVVTRYGGFLWTGCLAIPQGR